MLRLKLSSLLPLANQHIRLKDSRFTSAHIYDAVTYIGFLIFVLALPFGYSTAFLNIGLSFVLFGWVGRIIVGTRSPRPYNWQRTPLDIPILLFLGLGLVASLLAPHPATSSLGYFWKHLRAVLLFMRLFTVGWVLGGGISLLPSSPRQGSLLHLDSGITQMTPA